GLIGDPACAVVDHENESTGQQQKPDKSEKTADHASPLYLSRPKTQPAINGVAAEIQPHQHLIGVLQRASRFRVARKPLTLQNVPSIRAPMAAGAIPPPLFFERHRRASIVAFRSLASAGC